MNDISEHHPNYIQANVVRGDNNYRDYTEEAVEHLRLIKRVQAVGFTLKEIKAVMEEKEGANLRSPGLLNCCGRR
jgi:DNA-binding transcriptional MerR regulator